MLAELSSSRRCSGVYIFPLCASVLLEVLCWYFEANSRRVALVFVLASPNAVDEVTNTDLLSLD